MDLIDILLHFNFSIILSLVQAGKVYGLRRNVGKATNAPKYTGKRASLSELIDGAYGPKLTFI